MSSDSKSPYPGSERPRVEIACANCRKSKIKCMSESPQRPCGRCEKKGLQCEYLPMRETPSSVTHRGKTPKYRPDAIDFPAGTFSDINLVHPYVPAPVVIRRCLLRNPRLTIKATVLVLDIHKAARPSRHITFHPQPTMGVRVNSMAVDVRLQAFATVVCVDISM
ncbi:hypothetical protein C8F01DRAFT_1257822 [Mycena amicta]|nr:hypothetical protein C8F01DRAFT_1257822 [Mycena amicta]